jgi:hypothetical protein
MAIGINGTGIHAIAAIPGTSGFLGSGIKVQKVGAAATVWQIR